MTLPIEVLFFGLDGLALHRKGRLGLSACLGKIVALSTDEMLSFGLVDFALRRIGQLSLLACLGEEVALSFEDVLSFCLGCNIVPLTCTLLEGEHSSTSSYFTMLLIRGVVYINCVTLCGHSLVTTVTTSYFVLDIFQQ